MKKLITALAVIILFTSCSSPEIADVLATSATTISATFETTLEVITTTIPTPTQITISSAETVTAAVLDEPEVIEYDFPRIDGSTSTIDLDIGIRAAYYNLPPWVAQRITHSKTFESFEKLLAGEVDLVLSVPLSAEQQAAVDNTPDFDLISVPIALEGFVFIVNPENPVQSLSISQIQDIYSGKITNWKEVGGDDAEIIAYQRNHDSGSQTYMTEFMGDTPLMKAPEERMPGTMGFMMTLISNYDNSKYAIGYSVYSYAAAAQEEAGNVRFLAIDGVLPSRETLSNGSYSLSSKTYAFYNANNPNPLVKELADNLITEEGQKIVADAGYIPLVNVEKTPAYTAKGTGRVKPENYTPGEYYSSFETARKEKYGSRNVLDVSDGINFLKDKIFEAAINDRIRSNASEGVIAYSIKNGYLYLETGNGEAFVIYDLFAKKKLEKYSDLFFKDSDFVPAMNAVFASQIVTYTNGEDLTYTMKNDFVGLNGEPAVYDFNGITLPENNQYMFEQKTLLFITSYNKDLLDYLVFAEYRDMRELFTDEYSAMVVDKAQNLTIEADVEFDGNYYFQVSSRYVDVSEINSVLMRVCETFYTDELIYYYDTSLEESWEWTIRGNIVELINHEDGYNFYRETGEIITIDDLFKTGYEEHREFSQYELDRDYDKIDYSTIVRMYAITKRDGKIDVSGYFSIDELWLNERYADIVFELDN
jgi:ABC-type phosphate transport system substrate-binding protein